MKGFFQFGGSFGGLVRLLTPAIILSMVCGCRAAGTNNVEDITPEALLNVKRGISQRQLETTFGVAARHEFTTSRNGTTVRCVSCQFASFHLRYYFVFTNDALQKIIQPPRFEHELSPVEKGTRAVWKSHDPQERVDVVLQAPDLDEEGITASIQRRYKPKTPDNALPGAIIAGVIGAPVALVRGAVENREIKALADKFDPYRVRLEMPLAEVEQVFGEPRLVEKLPGDSDMRYYGSTKLGTQNPLLWVSVVFRDDKAVEVFSDDFFNYRKVEGAQGATGK
jgi:hypothetical protein